ncbi:MAG: histidine phosphotransferase family protein [Pseudomonadota bacterium]
MGHGNVNIAALIGSRICHDLISPIGAIHNGLELLDMAGAVTGPEMGLIADSVSNAEARIRFFRLAYGAAGDQAVARSEIVPVLDGMVSGTRLEIEWHPLDAQPRRDVRLVLLAVQCLETALPYGGVIKIQKTGGDWNITGAAERMVVDDTLWRGLTDESAATEITPALVQFALLPGAARDISRPLNVALKPTQIEIAF